MRLKGIYDDNIIENKLKEVSLDDVADVLVGTFSGGMKRRLSVAVSGLGDPAVIGGHLFRARYLQIGKDPMYEDGSIA